MDSTFKYPEKKAKKLRTPARVEVPQDLKCKGCGSVIAEGVKVNAGKKELGSDSSTKIWRFTTKCVYCQQKIVLENLSGNSKYKVISGGEFIDTFNGYLISDAVIRDS